MSKINFNKLIIFVSIFVCVSLITIICICFSAIENDSTNGNNAAKNQAALQDNVIVLSNNAYDELKSSIVNIEILSDGINLTLNEKSVFNELQVGDIFLLKAENGSVLGEFFLVK